MMLPMPMVFSWDILHEKVKGWELYDGRKGIRMRGDLKNTERGKLAANWRISTQ
jgi:hypothetical protein